MSRSVRRFAAILAGYTVFGLFQAVANSLTYLSTSGNANWVPSIKRSLGEWYGWAALTPVVLWLASRFPLQRSTLAVNGSIHLAAMVGAGTLKLFLDRWVRTLLFGSGGYLLLSNLAFNFVVYVVIVAAAHGVRYYQTSRERELQASQLEARLAETRLQLLGMQLQPHFLFNTLNAISELVHEDPEKADGMIAGLSQLLRETLDTGGGAAVDMRRELHLLGCYVDIQRARFGPRLDLRIEADAEALGAVVPVLLLQTLVENSIRHGLSRRVDAGRIDVSIRRTADRVSIAVRDDGRGVEEESREGIGFSTTRARLQALFGPAHSVTLSNVPSGGTLVSIDIPYRPANDERVEPA